MLKGPNNQGSFYDAEYFCERLIPADNFYRRFKDIVTPLIKDENFASTNPPGDDDLPAASTSGSE